MTEDSKTRLGRIFEIAAANKTKSDADRHFQNQARLKLEQEQAKDAKAWAAFGESLESQCINLNKTLGEYGLRLNLEHDKSKLLVTVVHANARSEASATISPSEDGGATVNYLKPEIGNSFRIDLHDGFASHIEQLLLQLLEFHVGPN